MSVLVIITCTGKVYVTMLNVHMLGLRAFFVFPLSLHLFIIVCVKVTVIY